MTGGVFAMNKLAIDRVSNGQDYTITITTGGPLPFNAVPLQSTIAIAPIRVTASELRFVGAIPNTKVATDFPVTIQATDGYGAQDTSFAAATIALVLTDNTPTLTGPLKLSQGAPGGGGAPVLQITFPMPAGGAVTITNLRINRVGQGYTFSATGGGLSSLASGPFNITANQLVISGAPTTQRADAPFGFTVSARDGLNNVDAAFPLTNLTFTLTGGNAVAPAALTPPAGSAMTGGTITLTGMAIDRVSRGTNYTITVGNDQGLTNDTTQIAITANKLRVIPPAPFPNNTQVTISVEATDGFDTVDPTATGNVLLVLNAPSGGTGKLVIKGTGSLPPCKALRTTAANAGTADFTEAGILRTGATVETGYTITGNMIQGACPNTTTVPPPFTPTNPALDGTSDPFDV